METSLPESGYTKDRSALGTGRRREKVGHRHFGLRHACVLEFFIRRQICHKTDDLATDNFIRSQICEFLNDLAAYRPKRGRGVGRAAEGRAHCDEKADAGWAARPPRVYFVAAS